ATAGGGDGVQCSCIVGAVAARLDDDSALEAQMSVQCKELLLRRVDRRVGALGRERKARRRAEDVTMRVAGARGQRDIRLLRRWMIGQIGLRSHDASLVLFAAAATRSAVNMR